MKKDWLKTVIHVIGYSFIAVCIFMAFRVARQGQEAFLEFLKEDGFIENISTLLLFASAVVAILRSLRLFRKGEKKGSLTWMILALLFLFAVGEEISWGQRIFNFEPSDYFLEKNFQKETNIHNLIIGGVKINILLFSQLLTAGLVFYFLFLRILADRTRFFNRLVTRYHLPLPRWEYGIVMLVSIVVIAQIKLLKMGELNELVFSVIFFFVCLYPLKPGKIIQ